jgi:hypothetical protein
MSSALRSYAQPEVRKSKYFTLNTPCYYDDFLNYYVPVPFVYRNGVLDIALQDATSNMINDGYSIRNRTMVSMKEMGGLGLVTELGPNFVQWLRDYWGSGTYTVSEPAQVYKVQYTLDTNVDERSDNYGYTLMAHTNAYEVMYEKPNQDMITGDDETRYRTCWVFKTPLVIKTPNDEYFNFHSQIGYNNYYTYMTWD